MKKKKSDTFVDKYSNLIIVDDIIKSQINSRKNDLNFFTNVIKSIFFNNIDIDNLKPINKYSYIINSSIYYKGINKKYIQLELTNNNCIIPEKILDSNGNYLYGGYSTNLDNFIKDLKMNSVIQCGFSSNFLGADLEYKSDGKINTFEWNLINPITNSIDKASIVDGGIYDNVGLISCLRRKVKNIHINIFCHKRITDKDFLNNDNDSGYFKFFEGNDDNNYFTLFTKETWNELYDKLLGKFLLGEPMIVNIKTEILSNKFLEIESYGEINILFHLTSLNKEWFVRLPEQTQKYILNEYDDFPYFNYLKYKYSPITMNLMYNLFAWEILNSKEYELFYSELNNK